MILRSFDFVNSAIQESDTNGLLVIGTFRKVGGLVGRWSLHDGRLFIIILIIRIRFLTHQNGGSKMVLGLFHVGILGSVGIRHWVWFLPALL